MLNAAEAEPLPLYPSSPQQGKDHIEEGASFSPDAAGAAALAFAEPVARAQTRHDDMMKLQKLYEWKARPLCQGCGCVVMRSVGAHARRS